MSHFVGGVDGGGDGRLRNGPDRPGGIGSPDKKPGEPDEPRPLVAAPGLADLQAAVVACTQCHNDPGAACHHHD
ncbi:hypothetical protein OWR29_40185 [Actinoplanes sp. Pm04-4]|uniref:Uncharacterized protein n=1 Tax=Paractinoplanes pyxinae TaxID=2997416 RepID=A0ABT4BEK4_9ACTN|nr:hypothetical protein [Actinoplanes pyxinae]MCY1144250.1 hypothetical protein [Actinoplanes pyxinae]